MEQDKDDSNSIKIIVSPATPSQSSNESSVEPGAQTEMESRETIDHTSEISANAGGTQLMEASTSYSDSGKKDTAHGYVFKSPICTEDIEDSSKSSDSSNKSNEAIKSKTDEIEVDAPQSKTDEQFQVLDEGSQMDVVDEESQMDTVDEGNQMDVVDEGNSMDVHVEGNHVKVHGEGNHMEIDKNVGENSSKTAETPSVQMWRFRERAAKAEEAKEKAEREAKEKAEREAKEKAKEKADVKEDESRSISSDDSLPSSKVFTSEAEVLTSKNEGHLLSRHEESLRKIIGDTNLQKESMARNAPVSDKTSESRKFKHKETLLKKNTKPDGTTSSVLYCCGDMNRISPEIGETSNSVPSSFNDNISNCDENLEAIVEEKRFEACPQPSNNEGGKALTHPPTGESKDKTEADSNKPLSLASGSSTCVINLQSSSKSQQSDFSIKSSDCFKVPELPKHSRKSPKTQVNKSPNLEASPEISKVGSEDLHTPPSVSHKRPTTLNLSPRTTFFTFGPGSRANIWRQCRSLPNVNLVPKKNSRRSSINFENPNHSVKALFTGEYKSKTPESSVSSIAIEKVKEDFLKAHSEAVGSNDASKSDSKEHVLGTKCTPESSVSNALSNKSKIRKKLIFVSQSCDYTNVAPTLQDSTSSLSRELSPSVSNLQIADSTSELEPENTRTESLKIEVTDPLISKSSSINPKGASTSLDSGNTATKDSISRQMDDAPEEIKEYSKIKIADSSSPKRKIEDTDHLISKSSSISPKRARISSDSNENAATEDAISRQVDDAPEEIEEHSKIKIADSSSPKRKIEDTDHLTSKSSSISPKRARISPDSNENTPEVVISRQRDDTPGEIKKEHSEVTKADSSSPNSMIEDTDNLISKSLSISPKRASVSPDLDVNRAAEVVISHQSDDTSGEIKELSEMTKAISSSPKRKIADTEHISESSSSKPKKLRTSSNPDESEPTEAVISRMSVDTHKEIKDEHASSTTNPEKKEAVGDVLEEQTQDVSLSEATPTISKTLEKTEDSADIKSDSERK